MVLQRTSICKQSHIISIVFNYHEGGRWGKNLPVFLREMIMEKEINEELRSLVHWSQLKGLPFGLL